MLNLLGLKDRNLFHQQTSAKHSVIKTQLGFLENKDATVGEHHAAHVVLNSIANPAETMVQNAEIVMLMSLAVCVLLVTSVKGYSLIVGPRQTKT